MKIAEIKSQIAELKGASRLHRRVINEIVEDAKDYEGENFSEKLKGRLDDIAMGLSSGVVGSLIYYSDTCKFFKRYQDEIGELLAETIRDTGLQPAELFGNKWDSEDPLCRAELNQNLLAWFAYEEIANQLRNVLEF